MNERIQKLADEAEDYADGIMDEGGDFHPAYTQKLAELIVQECLDQITGFKTEYHVQDHALAKIQSNIVKHFGVES